MNFKEVLEKDYTEMLDLEEAIDYSGVTYQPHIKEFIVFCSNTYPEAVCVTKEMVDTWLQQKQFQTNATHNSYGDNHTARFQFSSSIDMN